MLLFPPPKPSSEYIHYWITDFKMPWLNQESTPLFLQHGQAAFVYLYLIGADISFFTHAIQKRSRFATNKSKTNLIQINITQVLLIASKIPVCKDIQNFLLSGILVVLRIINQSLKFWCRKGIITYPNVKSPIKIVQICLNEPNVV